MCHFQGRLSLELLKLFHMFSVLLSRPQRDFLLSLYAKHCSKSHCKKDALPKSSHSTKTLGLYQIFLNLPKALSTVILHFVRLLFFFFFHCSPNTSGKILSAVKKDVREGFQEERNCNFICCLDL